MPSGYLIDSHTRLVIRKLLKEGGVTHANIAQRCGCHYRSVEDEARRMRQEAAELAKRGAEKPVDECAKVPQPLKGTTTKGPARPAGLTAKPD